MCECVCVSVCVCVWGGGGVMSGRTEGSTGSCFGFNASQKPVPRLKVSSGRLGRVLARYVILWFM